VSHRSVRSGAGAHTIGEHRQRAFQVESDQDALERSDRRLGIVERASMIPDGLPQDLHATPAILSGCDGLLNGWGAHRWRWRHVRVELRRRDGCMVLVLMLVLRHGVKRCALRGWRLRGILNRTLLRIRRVVVPAIVASPAVHGVIATKRVSGNGIESGARACTPRIPIECGGLPSTTSKRKISESRFMRVLIIITCANFVAVVIGFITYGCWTSYSVNLFRPRRSE